jgi:hypothetical protein|tara:strand:- start:496 stop:849 length:354 start_codon:yes stop_codon:yes gene_type:complete
MDKKIVHIKSNVIYKVKGTIKAKINGVWGYMILYENDALEQFARKENDFGGFLDVEPEFSVNLGAHIKEQGCLQVDTSARLSLAATTLLDEAISLVKKGVLSEVSGIHKIRTFSLGK